MEAIERHEAGVAGRGASPAALAVERGRRGQTSGPRLLSAAWAAEGGAAAPGRHAVRSEAKQGKGVPMAKRAVLVQLAKALVAEDEAEDDM